MSALFSTPAEHAFHHPEIPSPPVEADGRQAGSSGTMGMSEEEISEAFEVERTAEAVQAGGYKTIALQFPDSLLPFSVSVFRSLQRRLNASSSSPTSEVASGAGTVTGAQCYVLADSTYGSCCPDVLSCLHLPADLLVHYGHACLTATDALPVLYIFPRQPLDVADAWSSLLGSSTSQAALLLARHSLDPDPESVEGQERSPPEEGEWKKGVIVVWDVAYDWKAEEIASSFTASASTLKLPISFASIQRPPLRPSARTSVPLSASNSSGPQSDPSKPAEQSLGSSSLRSIHPPPELDEADCLIWYIGPESRSLVNLQMTHSNTSIIHLDPSHPTSSLNLSYSSALLTGRSGASPLLARRLTLLLRCLSLDIFGLLVSNIGLRSSIPLLHLLRRRLREAGKKAYTVSVGRLNEAKLANFEGIECWVVLGCEEGGLVDSKGFLRPIITPWELLLALDGDLGKWDPTKWTLDFDRVIADADAPDLAADDANAQDNPSEEKDADEPHFDLSTGTYRTRKTFARPPPSAPTTSALLTEGQLERDVGALTVRDNEWGLAKLESAGSNYLASREWKGLEMRYGQDDPAVLEEGRSGIARGYGEAT